MNDHDIDPSPVRVVVVSEDEPTEPLAAQKRATLSFLFTLGTEPSVRLIPRNDKRSRAVIQVNAYPPGQAAVGGVVVGGRDNVINGTATAPNGYYLTAGQMLEYDAALQLFAIAAPGSSNLIISVLDEWDLG